MSTSPQPCTTPNGQSPPNQPNTITRSPSNSNAVGPRQEGLSGLDLLSSVVADDVYSPAIQLYDDSLTLQIPVVMSPVQDIVRTITQTSPGSTCTMMVALFQDRTSQKCRFSTSNGYNFETKHKSWKGTHNSKMSMMLYLHKARICATTDALKGQAMSTNGLMHHVYSSFGHSRPCKSYVPFNKLQSTLTDTSIARVPLTIDHHRLLLEDFVKLKPSVEITFLISRMNHFLKDPTTLKMFENELVASLLAPRVISRKHYFAFQAVVCSNPKCTYFVYSNLTNREMPISVDFMTVLPFALN